MVGPVYLAEMAPAKLRGTLNVIFQLFVTVGILAAGLINYGSQFLHPWCALSTPLAHTCCSTHKYNGARPCHPVAKDSSFAQAQRKLQRSSVSTVKENASPFSVR